MAVARFPLTSTRRGFLTATFAVGAALAIDRISDGSPPLPRSPEPACTLGFSTYGMKSLSTEAAIIALRDIGFDSTLLACMPKWDADPDNLSNERRQSIFRQLADSGLSVAGLMDDFHPSEDDKVNARLGERMRLLAQLGHELSPQKPVMIETMVGGKGEWEAVKSTALRALPAWVKLAETEDFTLTIKPHRGTPMSRPEQAIEIFEALGKPRRLRMCYDYSHFVHRDMPMEKTIRDSLPWTSFIMMKDVAIENKQAVFKLPGETGEIDYPALLRQFYQGGYRGDFCCEVSVMISKKEGYDGIAAAKTCYANMSTAFATAGVPRPAKTRKSS